MPDHEHIPPDPTMRDMLQALPEPARVHPRGEQLRHAIERYVQGPDVAGDAYHTVKAKGSRRGFYDLVVLLTAPPRAQGLWLIECKCVGEKLTREQVRWKQLAEALSAIFPCIRYRLVDARNALVVAEEMGLTRLLPRLGELGCQAGGEERDADGLTPRQRAMAARLAADGYGRVAAVRIARSM